VVQAIVKFSDECVTVRGTETEMRHFFFCIGSMISSVEIPKQHIPILQKLFRFYSSFQEVVLLSFIMQVLDPLFTLVFSPAFPL